MYNVHVLAYCQKKEVTFMRRCFVLGLAIVVALSLLTNCSGGGGGGAGDGGSGPSGNGVGGTTPPAAAPEISAQSVSDFGATLLGQFSEREVVVNNVGT